MIPQRNLSLLSNELARKGGRRIPESVLERDYCLSWFLVGLSQCSLREILLFKGGTAIKKCHIADYRFSEDLDFTFANEIPFEKVQEDLEQVFPKIEQQSGIKFNFSRLDRHAHQNSHTFFLGYEGPLPAMAPKEVKVDITIRERVVFSPQEKPVLAEYAQYEDIPKNSKVRVYSLDEIASEKVVALSDRARNEPRDLYDLWHLTSNQHVDIAEIFDAIGEKLTFRKRSSDTVGEEFSKKEARLKKLWSERLSAQVSVLPEFDEVYRTVKRELRQAGF
ncbi:MAG TPA: nucleotidyl transferase AbiEii/AbiGii toxin family protein [Candidatus Omnitrophota bacterium]|nr:nucleotidyl transferase AbiEii/AbiGii toxin family protein [Candidatus Omnitrophota bacterium]